MATQVQFRGGTTSEHSTFTGVAREVTVDTTKKTVVVHDGSTAGGIPLAKESAVTSAAAITGGSINGTTVGASTASTGRFTSVTNTGLTSGRVTYAGASGLLSDSANLFWDNTNARLGIGTASPGYKLHVVGSGTNAQARIESTSTANAQLSFVNTSVSGTGFVVGLINDTSGNGLIYHPDAKDIQIYTNAAERMRITSTGLVGIGTSSPGEKLDISGGNLRVIGTAANQNTFVTTATSSDLFRIQPQASGTGVYLQATDNGQTAYAKMGFYATSYNFNVGNVGIGTSSPTSPLQVSLGTTGQPSFIVNPTGLTNFVVIPSNSGSTGTQIGTTGGDTLGFITNSTERMRIESGGNLLVNTTTGYTGKLRVDNASADGIGVQLTGSGGATFVANIANTNQNFAYWVYSGSAVGSINTNGSTTSYNTTSDYRLKENVVPITGALAKVTQLKPVTYRWKESGLDGQGFIAHELQAVVPDCVTGEKDAIDADGKPVYQQMDTSHLVATLVSAIQELKAEFDAYKATHP